jgi:hypothetical protein
MLAITAEVTQVFDPPIITVPYYRLITPKHLAKRLECVKTHILLSGEACSHK